VPQIEVTFDIDANGIVHVFAKDMGTGKEQSITITASSNLSEKDIDEAIKNAEKFAEEDKKRKELVDAKNHADMMVTSVEKVLADNGEILSEEEKTNLTTLSEKVKEAAKTDNMEDIKAATTELEKASGEIFTKIYQAAAQKKQAEEGGAEADPEIKVEEDNN
jgi:molecular chaperone DnaK